MQLQPTEVRILLDAIERSFDPLALDRLLDTRFGMKLHNLSTIYKRFPDQVLDVHRYFDQRNRSEELIALLRDARPAVADIVALADRAGFSELPTEASLEVLVRKDGRHYSDVTLFRTDLSKRENSVCRVETQHGFGTGSLIGSEFVLTNHHVVAKSLDENGALSGAVACLFDYKQDASGYTTPGRRVAVTSVAASSPHAAEDLKSNLQNIDKSKLDYAILRLERKVGNEPVVEGGENRGFIPIAANPRLATLSEGLLVLQHPKAKPMKIDIGTVTWTGATRIRHSVNTEAGSSGSPVFNAELDLIAIHHAGYDWPSADYAHNQAVPVALVAADARSRNVPV